VTAPETPVGHRRFALAAAVGWALAAIPFVWVLWNGRLDPLRRYGLEESTGFYDTQARALLHGHLSVPRGSLGIEEFVVHGRSYMYFGPFPAVLRMPVLAVTHRFDGRLTTPSILLAWLVTGLVTALLLWRVRGLVRGDAPLGRAEAVASAALMVAIGGGSVLLYLASTPVVYEEAISWGIALGIGTAFAVLGVLERPSWRRIVVAGLFTLAAVLTRSTMGYGGVVALGLASAWLALGRSTRADRRWWLAVAGAAAVPLLVSVALNLAKFGTLFSLPLTAQVWTNVSPHRQEMLAANGGSYFRPSFLPSTLLQYLRPDALRVTRIFPFVTMPSQPAPAVAGAVLDETYRTSSVPASMPMLFLLGVWGVITSFRPHPVGRAVLARIPLIGTLVGTSGVLLIGYIANRYLGDFVPLLVVAAAVGFADLWRRAAARDRPVRVGLTAAVVGLALVGVVTNLALAYTAARLAPPGDQAAAYVRLQADVSDRMGHPLERRVVHGDVLPPAGAPDELFVVGDCAAMYLSTGETYGTPWIPLERTEAGGRHDATVRFGTSGPGSRVPLLVVGDGDAVTTVWVEGVDGDHVRFGVDDPTFGVVGDTVAIDPSRVYDLRIIADPQLHDLNVTLDGTRVVAALFGNTGAQAVPTGPHPGSSLPELQLTVVPAPEPTLCRRLTAVG
jgi:hypothetical protein